MKIEWGNVAAGFTAACALAVSTYTAVIQRQQMKAQVWPLLSWDFERAMASVDGKREASFEYLLQNKGVGPAIMKSVEIAVDGHALRDWNEVFVAVSRTKVPTIRSNATLNNRVLAGGETLHAMKPVTPSMAETFGQEIGRIEVRFCYCSVLDDCWTLHAVGDGLATPEAVPSCPRPATPFID